MKIKLTKEGITGQTEGQSALGNLLTQAKALSPKDVSPCFEIHPLPPKHNSQEWLIRGLEAPIVNALRRVVLSQIPTMAVHRVSVFQNTSVMPDEVLAHRLGLIPIQADAEQFSYREDKEEYSEKNSIKFHLSAACTRKAGCEGLTQEETDLLRPHQYLDNCYIYASDFKWVPLGSQKDKYPRGFTTVHPKIIILKLGEGQEISLDLYCQKGTAKMHAKWSTVETVSYKLLPFIKVEAKFSAKEAKQLVECCPVGVFETTKNGAVKVAKQANCTSCRNCMQKFEGRVEVGKRENEYLFKIESVGCYSPMQIMSRALGVLEEKVGAYRKG